MCGLRRVNEITSDNKVVFDDALFLNGILMFDAATKRKVFSSTHKFQSNLLVKNFGVTSVKSKKCLVLILSYICLKFSA